MGPLKILVIPGYRIFPIGSGGAHGQLTFMDKQQHQHSIDLVCTPDNISEVDLPDFRRRFPQLNLIPIGYKRLTGLQKGAAFLRKQMRKWSRRDLAYRLNKSREINGIIIREPGWIEAISRLTATGKYDIIQVEHAKNLGLVEVLKGTAKKIFIHHEIYHTRVAQDLESLKYSGEYVRYISSLVEAAEIAWLNKYDGLITFNEDDTRMLEEKGVRTPQQVAQPFALFDDELKKIYEPGSPPVLVFVGGETHFPNKEGLEWFLQEILPLVRQHVPNATVKVTGDWTPGFRSQYASDQHLHFTGFVEDIDTVLKNAILIVPIRIGSGVRVKVFTSFAKGLPIVSTTLGASGIPGLVPDQNVMIADDAGSFSTAVAGLLLNEAKRRKLSDNAYTLAITKFKGDAFVEERNLFYQELLRHEVNSASKYDNH